MVVVPTTDSGGAPPSRRVLEAKEVGAKMQVLLDVADYRACRIAPPVVAQHTPMPMHVEP